jgi:hypothetical protein
VDKFVRLCGRSDDGSRTDGPAWWVWAGRREEICWLLDWHDDVNCDLSTAAEAFTPSSA